MSVAAFEFAEASFTNFRSARNYPSTDQTSDFALLTIVKSQIFRHMKIYKPHYNAIPISIQRTDENPAGGKVHVILGNDQVREALLEDGTSCIIEDDVILEIHTVHLELTIGKFGL